MRSWLARPPAGWRQIVEEKIPLVAMAAVSCGIVLVTHGSTQVTRTADPLTFANRLANALVSYAAYLSQTFYPVDLAPVYPHLGSRLPFALVAGSFALLMTITAIAAYCRRRRPYLFVGWFWFLGMLVPVIGLVGVFVQSRADRYTYLSQIGLSIALGWGVWDLCRSRERIDVANWRRWTLAAVSGGALLALAGVAWRQTSYWRNAEELWTHTISCTEDNLLAHFNLAVVCHGGGRTEEAMTHLREGLLADSIDSELIAMAHLRLADHLTERGEVEEALTHYEQAVAAVPQGAQCHRKLAVVARTGRAT